MGRERVVPERFSDRNIYSISRLDSYMNCEHGYYLNYVLKNRGKGNIYSLVGGKAHELLEEMQFGNMTNEEALKKFRAYMFECTEILGHKFSSDKIRTNYVNSVEHFLMNYTPIDCKEFKSELEFFTEIGGEVLIGYIDGVIENHDGTIEILDYKTSTKFSAKELDKKARQLVVYALAMEQEYGIQVHKVKWNMLKYCTVTWQGVKATRSGYYLRCDLVKSIGNEIKKDLTKIGYSAIEVELLLEKAIATNDMTLFPQEVQDKYVVTDGFLEYPISQESKDDLAVFIKETVAEIEDKIENKGIWKPKEITEKTSFFCTHLCNHSLICEQYKNYMRCLDLDLPKKKNLLSELFG
jgi:hypothetical protein